jgi:flavin reductase (DIM6/NTAB) family NADH-FMN oxidoreductase RutF
MALYHESLQAGVNGIDAHRLRTAAGTFATGITIVSCAVGGGEPRGCAANAVLSVSLDPPLMLVSLAESSRTRAAIEHANAFAINVLPDSPAGAALCATFAGTSAGKFARTGHRAGRLGSPILLDALGWFECAVESRQTAGDHTLFIGRVVEAGHADGEPLVFFRGKKRRLAS